MSSEDPIVMHTSIGDFVLQEVVEYPNSGQSRFFTNEDTAIILDGGICEKPVDGVVFEYSLITLKQNEYMAKYDTVLRFLEEDCESIESCLRAVDDSAVEPVKLSGDRADFADATPLERYFEDHFISVFGPDSAKYLWKEYGFTDQQGSVRYLDYLIKTENGDIAVEENGVNYHHLQITGAQAYRKQLIKQNSCALAGIKLYRFSTEDCQFTERFEDDIRTYFGETTDAFKTSGLVVDRPFKLYEHQENTLEEMAKQRAEGYKSFLVVFPTASGKSKIVEEDMLRFAQENGSLRALVLVPNTAIKEDWHSRVAASLKTYKDSIEVCSFAYMARHYEEFAPNHFDYIVVDEAHHAVAPALKRTIQYFKSGMVNPREGTQLLNHCEHGVVQVFTLPRKKRSDWVTGVCKDWNQEVYESFLFFGKVREVQKSAKSSLQNTKTNRFNFPFIEPTSVKRGFSLADGYCVAILVRNVSESKYPLCLVE